MTKRIIAWTIVGTAATIAVGCATAPTDAETSAKAAQVLKASFKARGQAGLDRLDQDETQKTCTEYSGKALPKDIAEKIEKINLASIKWPADGVLMGDWRNGERIAQEGRGKQYSDDPAGPVGGNCYACHQLTPQEVSFGTIGPPLYQFGKGRGYNDEIRKYAYGKIWNAEAYSACSLMPRFGHKNILSEAQVKDLVALLMDPNSPVNK
ncbi:MAG: sulfur oxidation c-type cytochrome SoxX [Casimicrobiaceae bacterium]